MLRIPVDLTPDEEERLLDDLSNQEDRGHKMLLRAKSVFSSLLLMVQLEEIGEYIRELNARRSIRTYLGGQLLQRA